MYQFTAPKQKKRFRLILIALLIAAAAAFWFMPSRAETKIYYVTVEGGADTRNGESWATAYSSADFVSMMDTIATSNDKTSYDFYLAKGTYSLTKSLPLTKGVKLYGGFTSGDKNLTDRNLNAMMTSADNPEYATVLSHDSTNNKFSIVKGGSGATSTDTVLDGFTITGGNSNVSGGGMYNSGSSPNVTNCAFSGNTAAANGGGMYNSSSSPNVTNCKFSGNTAASGGGMYNSSGSPTVTNGTFSGNTATRGGGMYNSGSSPTVTNFTFSGNKASGNSEVNGGDGGGGMYNYSSSPAVTNCTFSGNTATRYGGAMYNRISSNPTVVNSIFWGNRAYTRVDIYNDMFLNGVTVKYSVVSAGYYNGVGIITKDPKLIAHDRNGSVLNDPTGADSRDVYIYVISDDTSSALGGGLAVGETVLGNIKVPSEDQTGRRRLNYYVDPGAYQYTDGPEKAVYGMSLDKTAATRELGSTTKVYVTTKPANFVRLAVSSKIADISSNDERISFTGTKRGSENITIQAYYRTNSQECAHQTFALTVTGKSTPAAEVTESTRTDNAQGVTGKDASGVIVVSKNTKEDFAIYDGFTALSEGGTLPTGIHVTSLDAVNAGSVDITTSTDIYKSPDIKQAIADYWKLGTASEDKVRLVEVKNTVGSQTGETLWAKFWRLLKSFVTKAFSGDTNSKYLPLQTKFVITSSDIAKLPDNVKNGLTKDNLLSSVDLFVVVSGDGKTQARSLRDIVSKDQSKFITVSGDNNSGYQISTRVLLFNMAGGIKAAPGAKWVQKFFAKSIDQTTDRTENNYFIVQDGADDANYDLCMAFACKEKNYAAINVKASGEIPTASMDWTISGDKYKLAGTGTWSGDKVSEDKDIFTPADYSSRGYSVAISGDKTKDLKWGGEWNVEAKYSKIQAAGVTLDKTAATLNYWNAASRDTVLLTATVSPDNALVKDVAWTTSNSDVASVDATGKVTPLKAGTATITATTTDGSKTATCAVTVLNKNWAENADVSWYDSGKSSYTLDSAAKLAGLAKLVNSGSSDMTGKTITISGDLDLTGSEWTQIGTEDNPFNGTFSGNGKTVTGLSISGSNNVGLIGVTSTDALVKDLTVFGDVKGNNNVGILVGTNNGTITNCTAKGNVSGNSNVGGIAGLNNGVITSDASNANVTANNNAGGIAGSSSGTIQNTVSTGNTTSASGNAGGIAGNNSGLIKSSDATGTETGTTTGGITGNNSGTVSGSNWITGAGQTGTGAGTAVSGDCKDYAQSGDMPMTCVMLGSSTITPDKDGGFYISAAAYPTSSTQIIFSADGVTFTPAGITADGTSQYVKTSGGSGEYTVTIQSASGDKLAEFTVSNNGGGTGSGGTSNCNVGFGALSLLLAIPLVSFRKKRK